MDRASSVSGIERVIVSGSDRGAEALAAPVRGDLQRAAESLGGAPHAQVVIVTGFAVPTPNGATPETDGPTGAAVLASAMIAIGAQVSLVTDSPCADVVRAALDGFGGLGAVPVLVARTTEDGDGSAVVDLIDDLSGSTTHVVFVERPGPAADGTYRSMNGVVLDGVAPLELFAEMEGAFIVAIGDGGNEIGMGKLAPGLLASSIERGSEIASTTGCDALIVAAVSNWGAYGLAAATLAVSPHGGSEPFSSLDFKAHRSSLRSAVAAGAVDGVSGEQTESVDGFEWDIYKQVLVAAATFAELCER